MLGHENFSLQEGNDSDEPDCIVVLDNKRIGIEVTSLHPDDVGKKGGSKLRIQEQEDARNGLKRGYWVTSDFRPALKAAIERKIKATKNYDSKKYDSLWLLITSNILQTGVAVSTTVSPSSLDDSIIDSLNAEYGESLKSSSYEMVHWCLYGESTYFSWSCAEGKWNKSPPPAPVQHYLKNLTLDELKGIWNNPECQKNPEAWCDAEIKKILEEFKQQ